MKLRRVSPAFLLVASLFTAGCQDDSAPPFSPGAGPRPGVLRSVLVADDTSEPGELLFDTTFVLQNDTMADGAADLFAEVPILSAGQVAGPVLLEVTSTVGFGTYQIPPAQLLRDGKVYWWRFADVIYSSRSAVEGRQGGETPAGGNMPAPRTTTLPATIAADEGQVGNQFVSHPAGLWFQHDDGEGMYSSNRLVAEQLPYTAGTVRVRLPSASEGLRMALMWFPSSGRSFGPSPDSCNLSSWSGCFNIPAQTLEHTSQTGPRGTVRVRVYRVAQESGALVVRCNGGVGSVRVMRADSISCTVETQPSGQVVDSLRWVFEGPDSVTVSGPEGSAIWRGPIVVGGTIITTGRINGHAASDTLRVHVQPRTWQRIRPVAAEDGHADLPDPPAQYGHLGHTEAPRLMDSIPADSIVSGPNQGWYYLRSQISQVRVPIHISRAFQQGHPWRESQHSGLKGNSAAGPIYWCAKSQVSQLERVTRQHEGLLPGLRSHMDAIREYFRDEQPEIQVEAFTAHRSQGLPLSNFARQFAEHVGLPAVNSPRSQHLPGQASGHPQGTVPLPAFPCEMRF